MASAERHIGTEDRRRAARRGVLLAAVTGAGLLLAGYVFLLREPRGKINRANCARITAGMSRAEVEDILGGPPGDYTGRGRQCVSDGEEIAMYPDCEFEHWLGNGGVIEVRFGPDGRVRQGSYYPYAHDGPLDEAVRWVRQRLR